VSTPEYPLLTVPGYELYQLAHLTSVAANALALRRRAAGARGRPAGRAPAASRTSTDAAASNPPPTSAFPGGFPAAAAALPSPEPQPSQDGAARRYRNNAEPRSGHPADARPAPSPRHSPVL
jgi:hypothetical protein